MCCYGIKIFACGHENLLKFTFVVLILFFFFASHNVNEIERQIAVFTFLFFNVYIFCFKLLIHESFLYPRAGVSNLWPMDHTLQC